MSYEDYDRFASYGKRMRNANDRLCFRPAFSDQISLFHCSGYTNSSQGTLIQKEYSVRQGGDCREEVAWILSQPLGNRWSIITCCTYDSQGIFDLDDQFLQYGDHLRILTDFTNNSWHLPWRKGFLRRCPKPAKKAWPFISVVYTGHRNLKFQISVILMSAQSKRMALLASREENLNWVTVEGNGSRCVWSRITSSWR